MNIWWLIPIVIVGIIVILFLRLEPAVKITSILAWITLFVAGYTMYLNVQIRDRQSKGIELGEIEVLWNGIHQTFASSPSLTEFYGRVYPTTTPKIDPILHVIAETVQILIQDEKLKSSAENSAIRDQWIRRIRPLISTAEFEMFWKNNKQFYLPETDIIISRIRDMKF